ncbi:hypothetical protein A2U01_0046452, partial [Trifolium medium]|nr:hypothetical protein [Trifolium medium]
PEEASGTNDSGTGGTVWIKTKPFQAPECKEGI